MKLNQRFGAIFDEIIKIKIHRKQLLNLVENLHTKDKLSIKVILILIKALVIVLSFNPIEVKTIIKFLKLFNDSFYKKKIINLFNNFYEFEFKFSDEMVERLIFNTNKYFCNIIYYFN